MSDALLQELELMPQSDFVPAASAPLESTQSAANAIKRVSYSHDAMIDLIIAQPGITHNELAANFGYTFPWVSRVVNSDAFQARLAARKKDIIDPQLILSIEERFRAVAAKSLDVVLDKLHAAPTFDQALAAVSIVSKAMGYGARQANVNVQNNFVVALPQKAESSEAWAAAHQPGLAPPVAILSQEP